MSRNIVCLVACLASLTLSASAQESSIKVSLDVTDSSGVFYSEIRSALMALGDIAVVSTAEEPELIVEVVAVCDNNCAQYALSIVVSRPAASEISGRDLLLGAVYIDSTTTQWWRKQVPANYQLQMEWYIDTELQRWQKHIVHRVALWGIDRYEQEVRRFVAQLDTNCFRWIRLWQRALSEATPDQRLMLASEYRDRPTSALC